MVAKKPDDMRIRRNKLSPTAASKPVVSHPVLPEWDGKIRGPELPILTPDGYNWNEHTIRWYETWRRSAQAMYTTPTDWESLFMGAVIHQKIMNGVSHTALAALTGELRKRESEFGGSIESRRRIGLGDSGEAKEHEEEADIQREVKRTVNYFERLTGGEPSSGT